MGDVRSVTTRFGADTSGFSAGKERLISDLTEINKNFYANKSAMSEVNKEIKSLQKEMKAYNSAVGPKTAEQTAEYAKMETKLNSLTLKQAQLKTTEQTLKAQLSSTTSELNKQNNELNETSTRSNKASNSISGLATVVKGVVLGMAGKGLVDYIFGSNAQMEQYQTSFEVLLGSADKAKAMMQDLTDFAAKTPLELTDVTKQANQLLNYGVAAENIIPTLTKLGDLSSGNAQKLESVTRAYGQMTTNGKVSLEDLNQMTEAGVPILQALADTAGVATSEMRQMITDGKVGMPELNKAIDSLATGTGKFAGMMEKQAQTMNGMLSTLKDNFAQFGRDVGEEAFDTLKVSLNELMTAIDTASNNGTLEDIAEELGDAINSLVSGLISAAEFAYEYRDAIEAAVVGTIAFKGAMTIGDLVLTVAKAVSGLSFALTTAAVAEEGATVAQTGLNTAMAANPIGVVLAAVVALTAGLAYLASNMDSVSNTVKDYNSEMEKVSQNTKDNIANANSEGAVLRNKAAIYEDLRQKVNRTAEEEALLKQTAQELQAVLPSGTALLNEQTGTYYALGTSIDTVIEKMRIQAKLAGATAEFNTASQSEEKLQEALDTAKEKAKNQKGTKWGLGSILANDDVEKAQAAVDANKKIIDDYTETYTNAQKELTAIDNQTANDAYKIQQQATADLDTALKNKVISQETYNEKKAALLGQEVKATETANDKIDANFKTSADRLKAQKDVGEIDDKKYYSDLAALLVGHEGEKLGIYKDYYAEIYSYQQSSNKSALSAQTKADKALTKETTKTAEELADTWAKNTEKITTDYSAKMDDLVDKQDEFRKKLKDISGDLLTTVEQTTTDAEGKETKSDVSALTDYKAKLADLRAYNQALEDLKKLSDVPETMLEEIKAMSATDAIDTVNKLKDLSENGELADYLASYQQFQTESENLVTNTYASSINKLKTEFVDAYTAQLNAMPPVTKDVGTNIVQGLIDGMDSKSGTLYATAKSMCDQLMAQIHDGTGCASPSKITKEVGKNIDKGLEIGIEENMPDVENAMDNLMSGVNKANTIAQFKNANAYASGLTSSNSRNSIATTNNSNSSTYKDDHTTNVTVNQKIESPKTVSRRETYKGTRAALLAANLGVR